MSRDATFLLTLVELARSAFEFDAAFDPCVFRINADASMAEWAADGTLGRVRIDECEAAWVDIGGES